jgi:cytochrome P450
MTAATELSLPLLDHTDVSLRGAAFDDAMSALAPYDGWLCASPFGFMAVDRESGEFFLRTKDAVFPGLKIAELFGIADGPLHEEIVGNIINVNGDDHRRLRNLVNPALSPRAVQRYRPAMRDFLQELLDAVDADDTVEFIEAFAKPYPALVIATVMGAPLTDAPRLHHWSNWIQRQFDAGSLMAERQLIEEAVAEFYEYEDALIEARRATPGDDLISALITASTEDGDRLSQAELRDLVLNILVGGVDTSQAQLAHAVRLLALHPEQWQALHNDPQRLATQAIEEALRYEPITPFTARIMINDVEHRGVSFPAGSIVLVSAWHANRDSTDETFDITAPRETSRILTFGAGIHYCVGANLARAEMQEALVFLAERVERLELAGEPEFGTPSGVYGLDKLPLVLTHA